MGKDANQADIWWRIIRINGDGSIRMMYAGTSTNGNAPAQTDLNTMINSDYYTFNDDWDRAEYVEYQYTIDDKQKDSNAKIIIDEWFSKNLMEEYKAGYIDKNAGFCTDRTTYRYDENDEYIRDDSLGTGEYTDTGIYFGADIRIWDTYEPTLKCNNEDLLTPTTSDKGTQSLTYLIVLSSIDEQAYAGASINNYNEKYYLYNGANYWTMSPYIFCDDIANVFYVFGDGSLGFDIVVNSNGLRPVY